MSAALAVYVLARNPRRLANRAFFALMLTFVWWDACEAVERALPSGGSAVYPWAQGVWLGISAVPAALMQLAIAYPETRPWFRRSMLPIVYAPILGWAYLIFGTTHLISGVTDATFGPSEVVGDLYLPLAIAYAIWFYVGVALFLENWWRSRGSAIWTTQSVVVLGLLIGSVPAGLTEMFWPLLTPYPARVGLGSVYTLVWSVFLAIAIARYRYLVIEPVVEPPAVAPARHPLSRGMNYLVLEPGRSAGMGAFRDIVSSTPGLCVTGLSPTRVAARFGLERTPVLWITRVSSGDRTVRAESLDFELLHTALKFLRENPGTAVLLDDLDYLASVDGFDAVARFVKRVANQASASNGTVIATAGRGTLTPEQVALLAGCVDHMLEIPDATDAPPLASDHALLFRAPQDLPQALPSLGVHHALVVATDHPTKVLRRFGDGFDVLWITAHPEPGLRCARPTALDTEARRAVDAYLAPSGGVVILAGLEQIALVAGFPSLLAFVKDLADLAAVRGGRVIASATPGALEPREIAMVARRLDVPSVPAVTGSLLGGLSTAVPGSRTPSRGPVS